MSELSEAFQVGRITADEFDQRSSRALSARRRDRIRIAQEPPVGLLTPRA